MTTSFTIDYSPSYRSEADSRLGSGWHKNLITQRHFMGENWRVYRLPDNRILKVVEHIASDTFVIFETKAAWEESQKTSDQMMPDPETGRRPALYTEESPITENDIPATVPTWQPPTMAQYDEIFPNPSNLRDDLPIEIISPENEDFALELYASTMKGHKEINHQFVSDTNFRRQATNDDWYMTLGAMSIAHSQWLAADNAVWNIKHNAQVPLTFHGITAHGSQY